MVPPKDFPEWMSGTISLLVIAVVLGIGSFEIMSQLPGANDWRGAFLVAFAGCIGYWVGSSAGSKRKSDDAAVAAKTQIVAAEVAKAAGPLNAQAVNRIVEQVVDITSPAAIDKANGKK